MAGKKGSTASFNVAALAETFSLVANVPNQLISEYCTRYGWMLDVQRFAEISSDG